MVDASLPTLLRDCRLLLSSPVRGPVVDTFIDLDRATELLKLCKISSTVRRVAAGVPASLTTAGMVFFDGSHTRVLHLKYREPDETDWTPSLLIDVAPLSGVCV
jgi:hypothetical protein